MGIIESFVNSKESGFPITMEITGKTTWEEFNHYNVEQDKRFELARGRMILCSFISGFLSPFVPPKKDCLGFKWCPHKEWEDHFKKVL